MNGADLDTLMDRIVRTSAGMDVAIHRLLTDVRVLDGEGGWAKDGASSCSAWLMWKCNMEPGEAREKVRIANALGALPVMDEGLRRGHLSFSNPKARAAARAFTLFGLCRRRRLRGPGPRLKADLVSSDIYF